MIRFFATKQGLTPRWPFAFCCAWLVIMLGSAAQLSAQQPTQPALSFISRPITEAVVEREYVYTPAIENRSASALPVVLSLGSGPNGMRVVGSAVRWIPTERGQFKVSLRASLGNSTNGTFITQDYVISVSSTTPNDPTPPITPITTGLRFITTPPQIAYAGVAFTYTAVALYTGAIVGTPSTPGTPPQRPQITYSLEAAPQGMTIESTSGIVRWTPLATSSTSTVVVTIRANATVTPTPSGPTSQTSATQTFRVQVQSLDNVKLTFISQGAPQAITGTEYVYVPFAVYGTASGENPARLLSQGTNQDAIRYELVSGPQGMAFDATRKAIRWTPAATTPAGTVTVTVRASLLAQPNISTTQTFSVRVTPREQVAVRFTSEPVREANVGREYLYNARALYNLALFGVNPIPFVNVTNATGKIDDLIRVLLPAQQQNLTYSILSGPQGMTIEATTGTIRWTPRDTTTVQMSIRAAVTTNATLSSTQTFSIRVRPAPQITLRFVNRPPTEAQTGREYIYEAQALASNIAVITPFPLPVPTPSSGNVIRYALVTAPRGMTIDSLRGTVRWTPTDTGSVNVSVRATLFSGANLVTTATQSFTLRVTQGPCVIITGRVRYTDGSVVVSGTVTIQAVTSGTQTPPVGTINANTVTTTIQNGSYRITVRPGSYFLSVSGDFVTQWAINASSADRATRYDVKCGDSLTRDFTVERRPVAKFFLVSGKVTRVPDNAAVRATVEFTQTLANTNTRPAQRVFTAATDQNGNYSVALSNEFTYTVRAVPQQGSGLATVYYNGTGAGTTIATNATQLILTDDFTMNFSLPQARQLASQAASGDEDLGVQMLNSLAASTEQPSVLTVAPNPASSEVMVGLPAFQSTMQSSTQSMTNGAARLIVTNMLGITMLSLGVNTHEGVIAIDASAWPTGAYTVRLVGENLNMAARLLIAR
jgi:hypothetical protein